MYEKKMPSLKINSLLNSISSIMAIIFPLITYPYATRVLQAENLGRVNFASSTISYFSLIAVLGITSYAAREGVQYRSDRKKLNQFCSELFTLNIFTSIVSILLLIICYLLIPKFHEYKILLIIYSMTIIFGTIGLSWLYTLEEDYLYITSKSILIQFISLIILFVVVKDSNDYYKYAAINAFANVGSNIFNILYCRKYIDLRICLNLKKVFQHLKSCLIFFSSSLASSIYSNIDTTMLGFMCTDYHVGIYSASVKIYVMIKTLLTAITSVTIPRLTYYKTHNMEDIFQQLVSEIFKIMITLLLPVVIGINVVSRELVIILLGPGFEKSEIVLNILAFAVFFAMFATIINGCILLPYKKEKFVLKATITAAVINLIANLIAIPLFQQNGAAVTTIISECVVMIIGWNFARRIVKLEDVKKVVFTSTIGCIAIIVIANSCEFLSSNVVILLCLKVILSILAYFVLLFFMKNEIVVKYTKKIWEKVKL